MNKILWIATGFILLLVLLYFCVPVAIKHYLGKIIEKRNQTQASLTIDYDELKSQWPWTLLEFEGLGVHIKDCQPGENNSLHIQAGNVLIDNLSWYNLIFNRELMVEEVKISQWNLEIIRDPSTRDFYLSCLRKGGSRFPPFTISKITTDRGQVSFKETTDSVPQIVAVGCPTLYVTGFFKEPEDDWKYDKVDIEVDSLVVDTGSDLYQFNVQSVRFNSEEDRLYIENLLVDTTYPENEVAAQTGQKTHWYQVSIPSIRGEKLKLDSLFFNDHLEFEQLEIDTGYIDIYYDKRPDEREMVYKPLPHEWVEKMPWSLKYDTMKISGLYIKYREHVKEWTHAGELDFNAIEIGIGKFDSRKDSVIKARAKAIFVGQASLNAYFEIPAYDQLRYRVYGSLSSMDVTEVNPMLALVTNTHIASGISDHLDFWIDHDQTQSTGNLDWEYHDLKVALNEQKDEINLFKKVGGFFINTFIVKRDNTKEDLRPGPISFQRDTTKSAVNFWWKSLASGLQASVK